ncbi:MAG: type II toxin-antitoxin system HicA family toxin [Candidatus Latescibacterota bacterium]
MTPRHQRTLERIFETPERADLAWHDVVALLQWLGAELSEGRGSRVRVALHEVRSVLHRPHPRKEVDKGMVRSVRRFLIEAGVRP